MKPKEKYRYCAFGLNIESEIELSELNPSSEMPDAFITIGKTPESVSLPLLSGVRYQAAHGKFLLTVDNVARYYIENGTNILVEPLPNSDENSVKVFLLSSAIAALLHQKGLLPLHGSSVEMNGSAVIFAGKSGVGKSTLTMALVKKGYPFISDDISPIGLNREGIPVLYPGFPYMKQWLDSLKKLNENPLSYERVRPQIEKRKVPAFSTTGLDKLPIGLIVFLSGHNRDSFDVAEMKGIKKFEWIRQNTYRPGFIRGLEMQERHFKISEKIANHTRIVHIVRPENGFQLDELVEKVIGIKNDS